MFGERRRMMMKNIKKEPLYIYKPGYTELENAYSYSGASTVSVDFESDSLAISYPGYAEGKFFIKFDVTGYRNLVINGCYSTASFRPYSPAIGWEDGSDSRNFTEERGDIIFSLSGKTGEQVFVIGGINFNCEIFDIHLE